MAPMQQLMEYRTLGQTGLRVSVISLGSWATFGDVVDDARTQNIMAEAYELGINFFDGAEAYANGAAEEAMGRALANLRWPRETYLVSSKAYWGTHGKRPNSWGLSRKHLFEACNAALKRYQLDYLDLFLCHRFDPLVPLQEIVRAMTDLVRIGKVLHWGTSEWPIDQVDAACKTAKESGMVPPQVEQLEYNLLHRHKFEGTSNFLHERGIGLSVWSPLASGVLSGRYNSGVLPESRLGRPGHEWLRENVMGSSEQGVLQRARAMAAHAMAAGVTQAELALAWVLKNPSASTAITGASNVKQLHESVRAVYSYRSINVEVFKQLECLWSSSAFGEHQDA